MHILGQLRAGQVPLQLMTLELGKGSQKRRVSALGWVTPEADLKARIWDVNNLLGKPQEQHHIKGRIQAP